MPQTTRKKKKKKKKRRKKDTEAEPGQQQAPDVSALSQDFEVVL